jgi:hypothetical protein
MSDIATTPRASLVSGGRPAAIVPTDIEQGFRLARAIAAARWAPVSYLVDPRNREGAFDESKILIGILHGLEVGLTPIAALQSIAVINGVPSIWGDGALAIVQASGLMEDFREEPIYDKPNEIGVARVIGYRCTAMRRGQATPISHQFTLQDAAAAKLLEKTGPWQQYRARMLQMRARAWTLRAGFADVLRGLTLAEEAQDLIDATPRAAATATASPPPQKRAAGAALDAFAARRPATTPESSGDETTTGESDDGNDIRINAAAGDGYGDAAPEAANADGRA